MATCKPIKHGWTPWIAATWLACLLSFANWSVVAQEPDRPRLSVEQFRLTGDNLNEAERQQIYLNLIENFVGWTEASRRFVDSDDLEPGGGYFDAAGSGVNWQRGNGNLCLSYALLLAEYPSKKEFSIYRIPRQQLQDHLRRAMRSVCLSNQNASQHQPSDRTWGGPSWQSSLPMIGIAWTSIVGRDQLDQATLALVKELVCRECDHLEKPIPSGTAGNTRAEDCAWNSPLLAFGANFYPDHPHAKRWDELSKKWALNAISIQGDRQLNQSVDGRPLSQWMVSENVFPDLTIENHNMWSVGYQCTSQHFGEGALAYQLNGNSVPEAFSFRAQKMWQDVTRWLFLWDGDILFPHGQDWSWKTYSTIEYLCWQYCCQGNADAGAYESRALQMVYRRQLKIGTGDLGATFSSRLNFGNQTVKPKRWAFCYLMHKHFSPPAAASMTEADENSHGVQFFRHTKTAIHRNADKCVSVSWHPDRQPIYVIPEGNTTFARPPFFVPYNRDSGSTKVIFSPRRDSQVSADEQTEQHPVAKLADFESDTFWVGSHGQSKPGDGPTAQAPMIIRFDFDQVTERDQILLQSRQGFGPKTIELQALVSPDNYSSLGMFSPQDNDKVQVFDFPKAASKQFRLVITDSYDRRFPDQPRNVQIRELEVSDRQGSANLKSSLLKSDSPNLMEATPTHQGKGMRVRYMHNPNQYVEQCVLVWSLPNKLTIYATEFRALRAGLAETAPAFPIEVSASPGFETTVVPEHGRNWLSLQNHLGVISTKPIPAPQSSEHFSFSTSKSVNVKTGQRFGLQVLVVACGEMAGGCREIAATIQLDQDPAVPQLTFETEDGRQQFSLPLFDQE